jgi:hypothetical protein
MFHSDIDFYQYSIKRHADVVASDDNYISELNVSYNLGLTQGGIKAFL